MTSKTCTTTGYNMKARSMSTDSFPLLTEKDEWMASTELMMFTNICSADQCESERIT